MGLFNRGGSAAIDMHGRGREPAPPPAHADVTAMLIDDPALKERVDYITDAATRTHGGARAAHERIQTGGSLRAAIEDAEHALAAEGNAINRKGPEEQARLERNVSAARDELKRATTAAQDASALAAPWMRLRDRIKRYLVAVASDGYRHVEVRIPKDATIESLAAQASEARRQITEVEAAPKPFDEALQVLRDMVGDRVKKPELRVSPRGISVIWPTSIVKAESRNETLPTASDAEALACWLNGPQILAELEGQLKEAYEGITGISRADKSKRIAALKAKLMDLDRIEAELTWQAIAAGQEVSFRQTLDIRAIIGIDGPTERD